MSNYKEGFNTRKKYNIAEDKAVQFYDNIDCFYTRYGLDLLNAGLSKSQFCKIPSLIRSTPDYLVIQKKCWLVEVKGCRDYLRLKLIDEDNYAKWNEICPVVYFIYSTIYERHVQLPHRILHSMIRHNRYPIKQYPDNNKKYYEIPVDDLYYHADYANKMNDNKVVLDDGTRIDGV